MLYQAISTNGVKELGKEISMRSWSCIREHKLYFGEPEQYSEFWDFFSEKRKDFYTHLTRRSQFRTVL